MGKKGMGGMGKRETRFEAGMRKKRKRLKLEWGSEMAEIGMCLLGLRRYYKLH